MHRYTEMGQNIGRELYESLSDDHHAMIAFGMFPSDIMAALETRARERLAKVAYEANESRTLRECFPWDEYHAQWTAAVKPEPVAAIMRGVTLGLMEAAKSCGQMIA